MSPHFIPASKIAVALGCAVSVAGAAEPAEAKRSFNLPRGDAATTLSQFGGASGRQIIYMMDKVRGEQTNAVAGEFSPREALERMLAGTALSAWQDSETGAFVIKRDSSPPSPDSSPPTPQSQATEVPSLSMKRKNLLAALAGWLAFAAAPANHAEAAATRSTSTIEGRVLNATSGAYLNNARVSVEGTNLETFTNEDGEYRLSGVPEGTLRVSASFIGLATHTETLTTRPDEVTRRDFDLSVLGRDPGRVVALEAFTVQEREMTEQAIALQERRNAPNIKNVIAIDSDTGEGNVGEFLRYVPGIGLDENPQSPQFVSIRGMPASGTLVTTNGMEMASNSYTNGRETDLGVAATGHIARIEVTKVPTPDMPANAVGGSINMVTKSGFSRKRPLLSYNFYGTLTMLDGIGGNNPIFARNDGPESQTNRHRIRPSFNLSYLAPINKSLAFTASLSKSDRIGDRDYRRPVWNKVTRQLTSNSMNALVSGEEKLLGAVSLDWKISPQNTLSVSFSQSEQENLIRQNVITSTFGAGAVGGPDHIYGAPTGVGSVAMDPIWYNAEKLLGLATAIYRYEGAVWRIDGNLSYSKVKTDFSDMEEGFFYRAPSTTITNLVLRNERVQAVADRIMPIVEAFDRTGAPVNIHDANNYTLTTLNSNASKIRNEGRRVGFNIGRDIDASFPITLKAGGALYQIRNERAGGAKNWTFSPPGGVAARRVGNYDLVPEAFSSRVSFRDANGNGVPVTWLSLKKLKALYDTHPDWFVLNETGAHQTAVNFANEIEETISAAYIRADFKFFDNRLWIVGGVRYERTDDEGWGPLNDIRNIYVQDANGNLVRDANGNPIPKTNDPLERARLQFQMKGRHIKRNYDGYYPSFNLSYSLTDYLVLRAAYARTIGRPNFPQIIPGLTVTSPDVALPTITVVNTALNPWTADNYDVSLEMYELKGATASVSLFRKDVQDFFGSVRTPVTPELLEEYGLSGEYSVYDIVTTINAGSARVTGVEFAYRQSFGDLPLIRRGLQGFFNVTSMAVGGENRNDFTNFNPRIMQYGLNYARNRFSAKLSVSQTKGQRRSPAASATVEPGSYLYHAPQKRLDVTVAYMINRKYTLYADVRNLRAEPRRSGTWAPTTPEYAHIDLLSFTGAVITFGVRGQF